MVHVSDPVEFSEVLKANHNNDISEIQGDILRNDDPLIHIRPNGILKCLRST
jgi:hypothetical protein